MEARKVQLSGGTTYTISLPKSWAREYSVETGSLLYLRPEGDGKLVVDTKSEDTHERATTVDVSTYTVDEICGAVIAAYVVGVDRLTLTNRNGYDAEERREITEIIGDLVGVTIDETSETRIVVRSLIDGNQISIRKNVIRLRLVTLAMQRDAATAVIENDHDLAQRVINRDTEADKLFSLVMRYFRRAMVDLQVVKQLDSSRSDMFEYYYVSRQFERIADHAEKAATIATNQSEPPNEEFVDLYERLAEQAQTLVGNVSDVILGNAEIETAYRSIPKCNQIVSEVERYERSRHTEGAVMAAYESGLLFDSVKRTAEYGINIAELAIQQSIRTDGSE